MRVQVLCVLIVIGLVPTYLFFHVISNAYSSNLISQRIDNLQSYGTMLSNMVISSGYLTDQQSSEVEKEINGVAEMYQGRILLVNRDLRVVLDTYNQENGKTIISSEAIRCLSNIRSKYVNELGVSVQLTLPIVNPSSQEVDCGLVLSYSTRAQQVITTNIRQKSSIILLVLTVLILVFAILYSFLIAKPLRQVTDSIHDISKGNMDEKIDMRGFSEVVSISDSFNQMIDIIQNTETSRQAFVSNVSHELKTPLASMKVLSDSLLSMEGMPEEMYREFLVDITHEIDRMTGIINDLLNMVKMDRNSAQVNISNVSINDLLEQIIKRLRPIAATRNIELIYESIRPVMADVDEVKMSIALNNLIENSIKYNYDDGWVKITLNADHKFFYVTVQDTGVGIPEDEQDNVFERFYRVDKARSRETGGTGLGLSLTRSAILLHRGSIKLYSKEKEGTTFTIRIPLHYIAQE